MPTTFVDDPEEWERLTGERGSWIIEVPPRKRRPPRWGKYTPWHGELVMMPSYWETAQEPDDEPPREDEAPLAPTVPDS